MKRLTDSTEYCTSWSDCEMPEECVFLQNCYDRKIYNRLREYEDAEEKGLLIRLPCKVGDKAYYVHREYLENADKWINKIDEVEVDSFVVNINLFVNVSLYIGVDRFGKTLTPYKTLFFTREEAEKALAEMEK